MQKVQRDAGGGANAVGTVLSKESRARSETEATNLDFANHSTFKLQGPGRAIKQGKSERTRERERVQAKRGKKSHSRNCPGPISIKHLLSNWLRRLQKWPRKSHHALLAWLAWLATNSPRIPIKARGHNLGLTSTNTRSSRKKKKGRKKKPHTHTHTLRPGNDTSACLKVRGGRIGVWG